MVTDEHPHLKQPSELSALSPALQVMIDLVGCQTGVLDADLAQPFPPVCVRLDSVSLPPFEVLVVGRPICSHLLDVGRQVCRTFVVLRVDERARRCQGLVGSPAWAQNHGYDPCLVGVPPQFLADVVSALGVLERQVEETGPDGWQQPPRGQGLPLPLAVNLYANVLSQAFVEDGAGLSSLVITDHPADQTGTVRRRLECLTVNLGHRHPVRDVNVGVETVAHGPVEDPIQPSQVSVMSRRLHGHPDPVLGRGPLVGQRGQTSPQLVMVEDHHVGRAVRRGVVGEEAAADVVQVQTRVPAEAVAPTEGPEPQQDAEVPQGKVPPML